MSELDVYFKAIKKSFSAPLYTFLLAPTSAKITTKTINNIDIF